MPVLQRGQQAHTDVHDLFVNQGESARQVQDHLVARRTGELSWPTLLEKVKLARQAPP